MKYKRLKIPFGVDKAPLQVNHAILRTVYIDGICKRKEGL